MKREDILKAIEELGELRQNNQLSEEEFQKETRSLHELLRETAPAPITPAKPAGSELFATGGVAPSLSSGMASSYQKGDILLERYRLKKLLGEGGMGQVFLAYDSVLERKYALKVIRPEMSQDAQLKERFLNELRITEELTHPGVVRTYALLEDPRTRQLFFTMEYVEGDTLSTLLEHKRTYRTGPPLRFKQAMSILEGLSNILIYAHQKNVVHRDIKPSNIMLAQNGQVKLMDFGIARDLNQNASKYHTTMFGSVYYMAPEQHKGIGKISTLADVYSLGVVAYELLTGELPMGRALPPSQLNEELPEDIDEIILEAIDPRVDERTSSVEQFWKSLKACLRKRYKGNKVNEWREKKESKEADDEGVSGIDPTTLRLQSRQVILDFLRSSRSNRGLDLRGVDLSRVDFSDLDLEGVDLSEADLTGADLQDANLTRARLVSSNLTRANLKHANLEAADLTRATLDYADLTLVQGREANFHLATGQDVYASNANFHLASFQQVQFPQSTWFQATLTDVDFSEANLTEGQFWKANVSGSSFREANLKSAELREALLEGTIFENANLETANLLDSSLKGTVFKGANCRKLAVNDEQLAEADTKGSKGLGLKRKWFG
jgi:serine/threonine protein kinase